MCMTASLSFSLLAGIYFAVTSDGIQTIETHSLERSDPVNRAETILATGMGLVAGYTVCTTIDSVVDRSDLGSMLSYSELLKT